MNFLVKINNNDVRDRGEIPCHLVQNLLDQKIQQLESQIQQMMLFKGELEEYRTAWANKPDSQSPSPEICPLIASGEGLFETGV